MSAVVFLCSFLFTTKNTTSFPYRCRTGLRNAWKVNFERSGGEGDECWFAVGKRPSERGWENCTLSQNRPQNMHSERFFSMPKPSKILTIFRDPSRVKIGLFFGVLQGCDVNLWYFDFRKMGEIDSISFEIRVFLMKKARNRVVLASKTSDFSRQNIRTFGDKHPYFCPKKSDVFAFPAGKPRKMPFSWFCNISDRRLPWWLPMAFSGH